MAFPTLDEWVKADNIAPALGIAGVIVIGAKGRPGQMATVVILAVVAGVWLAYRGYQAKAMKRALPASGGVADIDGRHVPMREWALVRLESAIDDYDGFAVLYFAVAAIAGVSAPLTNPRGASDALMVVAVGAIALSVVWITRSATKRSSHAVRYRGHVESAERFVEDQTKPKKPDPGFHNTHYRALDTLWAR